MQMTDWTATLTEWWQKAIEWALLHGVKILVILILAYLLGKLARLVIMRLTGEVKERIRGDDTKKAEAEKRAQTLGVILSVAARAVIWTIAILMVLNEAGFNITTLLAGAGIAGLALGFGAQSVVKDMLAGMFILVEDQYRVGDVVKINNEYGGLVEKISLRTTWLRDLQGNLHIIPNGEISAISNYTHEWTRVVLDFGIAYKEDIDTAASLIKEAAMALYNESEWHYKFLEPPQVLGVEQLADSAVVIRMLAKTRPDDQWNVGRELRRRVKYIFDKHEIEIPFPHVTVYYGEAERKTEREVRAEELYAKKPIAREGAGDAEGE
ncbi:MAG: hypothetical protein B1H03_06635 [Planctomycetales bacterium 4484_113]|nr:MAG: hypothetical protein B1H03_06635 [Planctomycetales bacterium 4484_113]